MQILQTLFVLGLSSMAMAKISKCNAETASLTDYGRLSIRCGGHSDIQPWNIDLDSCFVNRDGHLVYEHNGGAFKSYKITNENKMYIKNLAVEHLEFNADGKPSCFGEAAWQQK